MRRALPSADTVTPFRAETGWWPLNQEMSGGEKRDQGGPASPSVPRSQVVLPETGPKPQGVETGQAGARRVEASLSPPLLLLSMNQLYLQFAYTLPGPIPDLNRAFTPRDGVVTSRARCPRQNWVDLVPMGDRRQALPLGPSWLPDTHTQPQAVGLKRPRQAATRRPWISPQPGRPPAVTTPTRPQVCLDVSVSAARLWAKISADTSTRFRAPVVTGM